MLGIVGWLCGSRIGRWLALVVLVVVAAGAAALWLVARGRGQAEQRARLEAAMAATAALATRVAVDRGLHDLPPAARRERLRAWARDRADLHGVGPDPADPD